jgi:hypothetical protein
MGLVSFLTAVEISGETLGDKTRMRIQILGLVTVWCLQLSCTFAQEVATTKATNPDPLVTAESDYILKDFHFSDGKSLPELKLHYRTIGQPASDSATGEVKNAVLLLHGTTGTGKEFLAKGFRDAMFESGQPLDAAKYYLILPDAIGLGGSSKPSDGLHDRFPHYGDKDMVAAEERLVTEGLGIKHLRLVLGTSMGGMHTWLGQNNTRHQWTQSSRWLASRTKLPAGICFGAASLQRRFGQTQNGTAANMSDRLLR